MKNSIRLPLALAAMTLWGFAPVRAAEPPPPMTNVSVTVKGESAKGQPIVFIPGLATPGVIWDDTVAKLQETHPCYVVTLAGFGGLTPPVAKTAHLLVDVRDQIIGYLSSHGVTKPLIVGHSLGGTVTLDIAATAPELPGRLLIVDGLPFLAAMMSPVIQTEAQAKTMAAHVQAQLTGATQEQFIQGQKAFIGGMVTSPEKAAEIAALTGKSDPATTGQAMAELIGRDLRPALSAIKCPVTVLGSLADKIEYAPKDAIEAGYRAQYQNLPQAQFEFFDKSKHFIMVDDPEGFVAALQKELVVRQAP